MKHALFQEKNSDSKCSILRNSAQTMLFGRALSQPKVNSKYPIGTIDTRNQALLSDNKSPNNKHVHFTAEDEIQNDPSPQLTPINKGSGCLINFGNKPSPLIN